MDNVTGTPGSQLNTPSNTSEKEFLSSNSGQDRAASSQDEQNNTNNNSNNNSNDNDSSGSSSEGKGSGSGGGYSADCSASDQESSDGDAAKQGNSNETEGIDLERLEIKDSPSEQEATDKHLSSMKDESARRRSSKTGASGRRSRLKSNENDDSDNDEQESTNRKGDDQSDSKMDEIGVSLPLKSPDMIDIDAIMKTKAQQDRDNAAFFMGTAFLPQWNGVKVENPMDPRIDLSSVNRVMMDATHQHPFLAPGNMTNMPGASSVSDAYSNALKHQAAASSLNGTAPASADIQQPSEEALLRSGSRHSSFNNSAAHSMDSYVQLMEVSSESHLIFNQHFVSNIVTCCALLFQMVRPFFTSHGVPMAMPPPNTNPSEGQPQDQEGQSSDKTQIDSSEGFTSFFTTTHSSQQSGSSSDDKGAGNTNKQKIEAKKNNQSVDQDASGEANNDNQAHNEEDDDSNKSDSSSMVVLARVKRKHLKRGEAPEVAQAAGVAAAAEHQERRVRIQEQARNAALDADNANEETEGSSSNGPVDQEMGANAQGENRGGEEESPESSGSSSSANGAQIPVVAQGQDAEIHIPPRIVTDISSNPPTSSASGSGSGGNTGSGTGSGTGSNQGSSGSGNEGKNSSEEGKTGSSGEDGKIRSGDGSNQEDISGESPQDGSDEADSNNRKVSIEHPKHHHHHHVSGEGDQKMEPDNTNENREAIRERKLQDKKRKRIEMRREYEAQQHLESSESSDQKTEVFFRPGRPVTFDQVLQFSKIARVVIQASPPFLAVHSNAAFTRLTGIDSHKIVGKPIKALLSLSNEERKENHREENSSSASGNPQASEFRPEAARPQSNWNSHKRPDSLERLVAASGYGKLHVLQVVSRHSQLVGKSVAFMKESPSSFQRNSIAAAHGSQVAQQQQQQSSSPSSVHATKGGHAASNLALKPPPSASTAQAAPTGLDQSLSSRSNSTSARTRRIACRASIAPIVSSLDLPTSSTAPEYHKDDLGDAKRRKLHSQSTAPAAGEDDDSKSRKLQPNDSPNRRPPMKSVDHVHHPNRDQRQLVTHYVIQLEVHGNNGEGGGRLHGSLGSFSSHSTSVEARLLGIGKAEVRHQRAVASGTAATQGEGNENSSTTIMARDEDGTDSTSTKEPVMAIG